MTRTKHSRDNPIIGGIVLLMFISALWILLILERLMFNSHFLPIFYGLLVLSLSTFVYIRFDCYPAIPRLCIFLYGTVWGSFIWHWELAGPDSAYLSGDSVLIHFGLICFFTAILITVLNHMLKLYRNTASGLFELISNRTRGNRSATNPEQGNVPVDAVSGLIHFIGSNHIALPVISFGNSPTLCYFSPRMRWQSKDAPPSCIMIHRNGELDVTIQAADYELMDRPYPKEQMETALRSILVEFSTHISKNNWEPIFRKLGIDQNPDRLMNRIVFVSILLSVLVIFYSLLKIG